MKISQLPLFLPITTAASSTPLFIASHTSALTTAAPFLTFIINPAFSVIYLKSKSDIELLCLKHFMASH